MYVVIGPTISEIKQLIGSYRCNQLLKVIGFVMGEKDVCCRVCEHLPNGYLFTFKYKNTRCLDLFISIDKMTYSLHNKSTICDKYNDFNHAYEVIDQINKFKIK